jgi:hypothetical protein
MVKRSTRGADRPTAGRRRRTPEELIADLEARIEAIKRREEARQLKRSAAMRAALSAIRALDKGLLAAEGEGDTPLRHALADAREPLAHLLGERGMPLERTRRPSSPHPK